MIGAVLKRGEIDLVIGPENLADPVDSLTFTAMIDDRVGVMCRTGRPLAQRETVMSSDLGAQVWLAHSRGDRSDHYDANSDD